MSDLTNAQRAQILVDEEAITTGATTSDETVASIAPLGAGGPLYVLGQAAGTAIITVTQGTSQGNVVVTVTDAPLVVTLGTPEPKV